MTSVLYVVIYSNFQLSPIFSEFMHFPLFREKIIPSTFLHSSPIFGLALIYCSVLRASDKRWSRWRVSRCSDDDVAAKILLPNSLYTLQWLGVPGFLLFRLYIRHGKKCDCEVAAYLHIKQKHIKQKHIGAYLT